MPSVSKQQWKCLRDQAPALADALSDLGREAVFPLDIPAQAAEARGKNIDATIGQITDGHGSPLALPAVEAALGGLRQHERAVLYSPVEGFVEVREAWRRRQRRGLPEDLPSTLPLVTAGLTHGLSLLADLFADAGTPLVVPKPFWGNYRQTFALRRGAEVLGGAAYRDGEFDPDVWSAALGELEPGRSAMTILNFPSNPGGYFPNAGERERILDGLLAAAEVRPLVAVFDDAYAGLVYEPECDPRSLFWDAVAAAHRNLIPVKVDGGTKEFSLFGGRVGFLTFGFDPGGEVAEVLESKLKCLSRATIGSPVALSQMVLLEALEADDIEAQVEAVRSRLAGRYRRLRSSLLSLDSGLVRPLACNAGCFALLEVAEACGCTSEQVRRRLLEVESVGVVAIAPRYLRIAFCSLAEEHIEPTVKAIQRAVGDLSDSAI